MTNYAHGQAAEAAAAHYLKQNGYKILARNWRTRFCEIDIVAQKAKCIYFVEVKYRLSQTQGSGFDYLTPTKLKRIRFAAEVWVSAKRWTGDYELAAIEVTGPTFKIQNFLDQLF